jgi:hypothetical protein
MTKRFHGVVLGLLLLTPSAALAGPISVDGVWSPMAATTDPNGLSAELDPFWAGVSWDGPLKGIGFLLAKEYGSTENVEYLHSSDGSPISFLFDDPMLTVTKFAGITAWSNGVFGRRADGAFTYDSGTGFKSNSMDSPEQYALFRVVLPEVTHYFMGIEDILIKSGWANDRDYNDYVVRWDVTQSVPEPGSLLLLGSGIAAVVARKTLAARKARGEATV